MSRSETVVARAKFEVPRIPHASLTRPALVARLEAGGACVLTLLAAAPGSGKTALLAEWVARREGPVAWLSCDADDADPRLFWQNVYTAVREAWSATGPMGADLFGREPTRQLAVTMANELAVLGEPGLIVVDDFHLAGAEPAVMSALIAALPPRVRLVLASRSDPVFPLGRLRVQGRLLELRQDDLRLSADETRRVLAGLGVELDDTEIRRLDALTEGWPAGVQLAGLSLRGRDNPGAFLRDLAETDRSLSDFLINEVIDLQPPHMAEFLTVTAELDTFDAALCDAVGGWTNSAERLRCAHRGNLFLTELDASREVYRYQPLFGLFLRARLRRISPERIPLIHQAAADVHAARGEALATVRHRMLAGDTAGAFSQLRLYTSQAASLDDRTTAGAVARAWLHENGMAGLHIDPAGVLECVMVLVACPGSDVETKAWLHRVEALEGELDVGSRFLLHGVWSFQLLHSGDLLGALHRARCAEEMWHEHPIDSPWVPALAHVLVQPQIWLDDLAAAAETLARAAARPDPTRVATDVRLPSFMSQVELARGELPEAERLARHALASADDLALSPFNFGRAEAELTLALLDVEHGHLDPARARLERLMRIVEDGRRRPLEVLAHLAVAEVASAGGEDAAAMESVEAARAVIPTAGAEMVARIDRGHARVLVDHGDVEAAAALWKGLPPSQSADLLGARLHLARHEPAAARQVLDAMPPRPTRRLEIEHATSSALARADVDLDGALGELHRALVLAQPVGFRMSLVAEGPYLWKLLEALAAHGALERYVAELLEMAYRLVPAPRAVPHQGLVEPLSERELTVLRHLGSRLDSTEIAGALYLSVNTVRSHVKAIYRKLGVNTRADAVRRAHELSLF